MNNQLEPAELRLKFFLQVLLIGTVLTIFFHVFPSLTPGFLRPVVLQLFAIVAANSIVQGLLIILLLAMAIGDVRRFSPLIRLFRWLLVIAVLWSLISWIKGWPPVPGAQHAWQVLIYSVVLLALWLLFTAAGKARYDLRYFTLQEFQTLSALAEVCIAGDSSAAKLQIRPAEVAFNVDHYMDTFNARSKWVMKLVLTAMEIYPLLSLHPVLSLMQPNARLVFLKKRFLTDLAFRALPRWYKQYVQAAIRMSKQLCYMGYYSDARVYGSIGYVRFTNRKDVAERLGKFPENHSAADRLLVTTEADLPTVELGGDVVIVGSGAAASILANQLVQLGRKVLLVERGTHEKPGTFNENEVEMVSRLYADGALQLSRDFRFQVFQGSCVGGSTVVNNAVCFKTPGYILDNWINDLGIAIDRAKYEASMNSIYDLLHVAHTPVMTDDRYLNPGGRMFAEAAAKFGYDTSQLDSVVANINGCLGCGYCNIGCRFGKKLSMLDTILPQTQIDFPGSLQILAGCEVISFNKNKTTTRIESITGKLSTGRSIVIKGKTFVSSAGAISSSILLLKSKLGLHHAGKKLAFNLGTQITAAYKQPVNSYDGLQISHFLKTEDRRFVMETWYNPPMFQSTAMPGWFEQHFQNMQQYANMACTGVLVGTASNAEVKVAGLFGRDINYVPTEDDFDSLMDGLEKAAEIYLADGAERVMPNTFQYYEYKTIADLRQNLRKNVKGSVDISTGTGHPQGGNVMSPDALTGVVDPEFKVYGYDNLFVCDASVFPTSLGVNPQITVMSLAHYAAPFIAANG